MSDRRLLVGVESFDYGNLTEGVDTNGKKFLELHGILQRSDTVNQNGRIYPRNILAREVKNYQKLIQENRSLGEADHPDSSVIELKNASHLITEAHMDDDGIVHGRMRILSTPAGQILRALVEDGVKLGISSRGVGSTKKDGDYDVVQDDFELICFDAVSTPSTPLAFMVTEGIIRENDLRRFFTHSDRVDRVANDLLHYFEEVKNGN